MPFLRSPSNSFIYNHQYGSKVGDYIKAGTAHVPSHEFKGKIHVLRDDAEYSSFAAQSIILGPKIISEANIVSLQIQMEVPSPEHCLLSFHLVSSNNPDVGELESTNAITTIYSDSTTTSLMIVQKWRVNYTVPAGYFLAIKNSDAAIAATSGHMTYAVYYSL